MQLREALRSALASLQESNVPSPGLASELLLMHVLGRDRAYLYTYPECDLSPEAAARYFELIAERATGKPTQYITGHQEFWGLDFEVTPDVLIPRPETEHLVEAVLELVRGGAHADSIARDNRPPVPLDRAAGQKGRGKPRPYEHGNREEPKHADRSAASRRILDVGTGSGCIALALASELPKATIVATDLSRGALQVAQRNARRLKLSDRVHFVEADLLSCFIAESRTPGFDFVVSNPPYVSMDEIGSIQREVRDFEPRLALGGSGDGVEIYGRLFAQSLSVLRPGGHVAVEIGYNQSGAVLKLLEDGWESSAVRPDLAGIPRVVLAQKRPLVCQPSAISGQQACN